ncbi:MAG: chitobiase/beta-hexosaminidase C-terminal domain-containing protein, partial [Rectinemataceae bacterium]
YPSNLMDIASSGIQSATNYWWQARAQVGTTTGAWSKAVSFSTSFQPAATPTFSPAEGSFSSDQSVTISCATAGASIYFTVDGSIPTLASTQYTSPISVAGNGRVKEIQAISVAPLYATSAVGKATFTIAYLPAETPTFSPAAGTFDSDQSVTISCATTGASIYYTTDESAPTTESTLYAGAISVAGTGTTKTIKAIATVVGYLTSAVGIGGFTIAYPTAATPSFSPVGGTKTSDQSVSLGCMTANATIYYTTNGDIPTTTSTQYMGTALSVAGHGMVKTIKAVANAAGYVTSVVGSETYIISYPSAATPSFSPAGGSYDSTQLVTITCTTNGATIYSTTDGSDPASSATRLSGASPRGSITATLGTKLRAVATALGYSQSAEGTATYMKQYAIGDTGPAGGIVFYDKGSVSDGWRYLEAAPSDQSTGIQWDNGSYTTTGAAATGIGSGEANTATIVASQGAGSFAASLCANLVQGGYDDWFLPSKDELDLIYQNLKLAGRGGFASAWYWSSSELNSNYAWTQNFGDGYQYNYYDVSYKNYGYSYVRALRVF